MAKGALSSRAVGLNPEANGDVHSFPVLSFNRGFEDPLCARHLVQLWGGSTVAKLKGPCPCGADLLVEKKASNQPANQRNKTMSGGDAHDMRTTKATQARCSFCFVFRLDSVLPALLGSVL